MIFKQIVRVAECLVPGFFLFLIMLGSFYYHEQAHQQISLYHGCEESKITYSLTEGTQQCLKYSDGVSAETRLQEANLQSWNEIIGYTVGILILFVWSLKYLPGPQ